MTADWRHCFQRWIFVLGFLLGVPALVIYLSQPFLDMSHATYLTAGKDYAGAIRALNRAIAFNGLMSSAYVKRGYDWEKLRQPDKARADYDRAIAINPNDWAAYNNRATLTASQDPRQSLMDATHAIDLCNSCPQAYETRAAIYVAMNDHARALADLDKAIELEPKFGAAYAERAKVFKSMNRIDEAINDARAAEELGVRGINITHTDGPLPMEDDIK